MAAKVCRVDSNGMACSQLTGSLVVRKVLTTWRVCVCVWAQVRTMLPRLERAKSNDVQAAVHWLNMFNHSINEVWLLVDPSWGDYWWSIAHLPMRLRNLISHATKVGSHVKRRAGLVSRSRSCVRSTVCACRSRTCRLLWQAPTAASK